MKKLFFSVVVFLWVLPFSFCAAMNLTKFNKPVADVFRDASTFLLSIVGSLAMLMIVLSGLFYIFSGSDPGKQEKAKKTFNYALVGLSLVLISYAIIKVLADIGT